MSTKKLDLVGLRQQFVTSKERVQAFALAHAGQRTKRQKQDGSWEPVSWQTLCTKAGHYYAQLIADIDKGTYVQRYKGEAT